MAQYDIGILGGGQLSRMMILAAHRMGLSALALVESKDAPAAQVGSYQVGDTNSRSDLKSFIEKCKTVTFESEFVDTDRISKASEGAALFPQCHLMKKLRDRKTQKQTFDRCSVATSPWFEVKTFDGLQDQLLQTKCLVLKKRLMGYDGYGTTVIKTPDDLHSFWTLNSKELQSPGYIAEQWIPFDRELAILIARNQKGEIQKFPWVETYQKDSRCQWVKGPIPESLQMREFTKAAVRMLHALKYVGIIAFEVFDREGTILLNEVAPRVHNSGHYSTDALSIDQFEMHLRAVLGLPLPAPELRVPGFAMWNLLGTHDGPTQIKKINLKLTSGSRLHWYGKLESRVGRKLGHINSTGGNADLALKKAKLASHRLGF